MPTNILKQEIQTHRERIGEIFDEIQAPATPLERLLELLGEVRVIPDKMRLFANRVCQETTDPEIRGDLLRQAAYTVLLAEVHEKQLVRLLEKFHGESDELFIAAMAEAEERAWGEAEEYLKADETAAPHLRLV